MRQRDVTDEHQIFYMHAWAASDDCTYMLSLLVNHQHVTCYACTYITTLLCARTILVMTSNI